MNYKQSLEFIDSANIYGSVLGLDNTKTLLKKIGNPQNNLKIIHVAGTNGKGSVIAFCQSVLMEAKFKVGRYISPSVFNYMEHFCIDGDYISQDDFSQAATSVKAAVQSMIEEGFNHPTTFEIETAIAFYYFNKKKCDFVLLEVGLGGSDDATNAIDNSLISVITSISLDHTSILGNTTAQIAKVKGGIIKNNGNVISIKQDNQAQKVISDICKDKNAQLTTVEKDEIKNMVYDKYSLRFDYKQFKNIKAGVIGKFQAENAAVCIEIMLQLRQRGYEIEDYSIINGIANAKWSGRFEIISKNPMIIIDGAHNYDASKRLAESIELYFPNRKIVFIIGILADKDYNAIIKNTVYLADTIYTITPDNSRALDGHKLKDIIQPYNQNVFYCEDIKKALSYAKENIGDGIIICFGSLSYIGKIAEL